MADKITLARPYAQAVFDIASAGGGLAGWSAALAAAGAVVSDASMAALVDDPRVSDDELLTLLQSVLGSVPGGTVLAGAGDGANLLRLLIENCRLPILPEISVRFDALKDEAENAVDVTIVSATPLDAGKQGEIVSALGARLGRKINATTAVDPDLIGGAVIRAGDFVIDGSVRAQLTRLQATLAR
ncbi:MAG: F0F1 ATP synthase subunit delta [Pseudomonadota bacterium]